MKLIRFGAPGEERPGILRDDGARVDASGFGGDWDEAFFGGDGLVRLRDWAAREGARAPRGPGAATPRAPAADQAERHDLGVLAQAGLRCPD